MRISDWSSDVCSSDLTPQRNWLNFAITGKARAAIRRHLRNKERDETFALGRKIYDEIAARLPVPLAADALDDALARLKLRSEEHTSELQSLMRISYAVFCLKKKKLNNDDKVNKQYT